MRKGEFFRENIDILERRDRELAEMILRAPRSSGVNVFASRSGMPSIRADGVTLHSLYDPCSEAAAWVEHHRSELDGAPPVCILGFGLGYHVAQLCRTTAAEVTVFEPRLDILRAAFEHLDLTTVLRRSRIVVGEEVPEVAKGFVVLEHKPSVNLEPVYFRHVLSRLKTLQAVGRGLKIMVVGPIYGGSLPVAKYCAAALRNLGHDVDFADNSLYEEAFLAIDSITTDATNRTELKGMFVDFASEAVIARCGEFKPDLLFALAQAPLTERSLVKLRSAGIPTAFWFVEDFRVMNYWQRVAPVYDYFFTIQRGPFLDMLESAGARNAAYLPLAASVDTHRAIQLGRDEMDLYGSDVSFVGAGYSNRRSFFEGLIDFDFKIWGNEWDLASPLGRCIQRSGARIDTEETVKIFNATKINVNLHSSSYHSGVNPYGDFVNPRTFEIAACEGFQLVDRRSEMSELFTIGEEIVCFEDIGDLRRKIRYYLDNPEERRRIARKGCDRVRRDHTYELRMKSMLDFLFRRGYELPPCSHARRDVSLLVKEAGRESALGSYLARFSSKGKVGLDDIVEDIRSGEGALSDVERIFLLMDSLRRQYVMEG